MEDTPPTTASGSAVRRLGDLFRPSGRARSAWSVLVPVVALLAGLLFTTSATTANGTNLREDRTPQLVNLIGDRQHQISAAQAQEAALRASVLAKTNQVAGSDAGVAAQQQRGSGLLGDAGLVAVQGPALTVVLNDAPASADGSLPRGATPDDVVVHQQDVQAVVNAMWAGGAEAMTIMGVRVISTSAVRCVGNTLLLQGVLYSPPFTITAIGNTRAMRAALDESPQVAAYRQAVAAWGLGYQTREGVVTLPAYNGSTDLQYAQAIR
ncbi:MAG TPA: DUF881 domain-containing protein [Micromonosporaceae bacterium]|jgi:uncharacterized protein YlxW (UPF0749 family)|nr:DUF881 domain-containing protein [Micromonosporaceae bacterium]